MCSSHATDALELQIQMGGSVHPGCLPPTSDRQSIVEIIAAGNSAGPGQDAKHGCERDTISPSP